MTSTIQQTIRVGLIVFILAWACTGCAYVNKQLKAILKPPPAKPEEAQVEPPKKIEAEPLKKQAYYIHAVRWEGESLSIIAKWYTGNLKNWKALAQANPGLNPSRIFIGNKIRIPENLLTTREPMPQEFVASFSPEPKTEPVPSKPAPPSPSEEEEQRLFGPKQYPEN